jgi:hypothetical protein
MSCRRGAARRYYRAVKIELLGLPDERTAALEVSLRAALARLGLLDAAEVTRVEDMTAIIARGVRQPPALRIDGRVVCRRRVPDVEETVAYLEGTEA